MSIPRDTNEQFENAVLGSILIDPKIMDEVSGALTPDDFYRTGNNKLYEVLLNMHKDSVPIDLMTVFEKAKEHGVGKEAAGPQRLIYLTETTPASANFAYYVKKVKDASQRREFLDTYAGISKEVEQGTLSVPEAWGLIAEMESSVTTRCGLEFISAKDIALNTESVQSLWGEVIYPQCITQINSEPGVGKTTFVYNLCVNGIKGSRFLDIPFSKSIKVLYIDVETPAWKRAVKLQSISADEMPGGLYFLDSLDMHTQFAELLLHCKNMGFDLIVFDTQSRIFNLESENDNAEANRMMHLIRRLVSEAGAAVILVHHCSKTDKKGVYSGRGASAIGGAVDVVVNLESFDGQSLRLKVDKNRISGDYMTLYIKKIGDDRFEPYIPPTENVSGFEKFKVQEQILLLSDKKSQWTTNEIQSECQLKGFTESTIRRALSSLAISGQITKTRRGEYEITGTEQDTQSVH
ncbi:MAG: AAA family ATPase [Candidatus Dadabacteria bacterium]|nr:AAA family ATPase [Candidatus Dadabacteria bacterium]NIS07366.1 AAA family ATPase [Candidatus Dadabacteria bacterium]NIY21004.1 AAA family ATPase [Candidatus Dadabacteria bacterium]